MKYSMLGMECLCCPDGEYKDSILAGSGVVECPSCLDTVERWVTVKQFEVYEDTRRSPSIKDIRDADSFVDHFWDRVRC